jgi:hypothetical protein
MQKRLGQIPNYHYRTMHSFGLYLIGSYFHDFFKDYYLPLFIIFGITVIWFVFLWLKKMTNRA